MGKRGREGEQVFQEIVDDMGSWDTRKNYKSWELITI
jgi:hypothetical protein